MWTDLQRGAERGRSGVAYPEGRFEGHGSKGGSICLRRDLRKTLFALCTAGRRRFSKALQMVREGLHYICRYKVLVIVPDLEEAAEKSAQAVEVSRKAPGRAFYHES